MSRLGPERFLLLGADYMQLAFMRHFAPHLPAEGVELQNLSSAYGGLHLCGPNAQALVARLAQHETDSDSFPFMSAGAMTLGNVDDVIMLRVSFTGETGYEMYLPMERQLALFDLLRGEGESLGLGLVGTRCLMHTRLEKHFPAWALELTADYTPAEAELDRFVKPDKCDFIGRDGFLAAAAPREKFAAFAVEAGDCAVWGDEAIFLDGEPVGYVTSGGYGPATEQHIALGYVNCDAYRPGGEYAVEILGQLCPAQLQEHPPYDPTGSKMRA